MTEIYVLVEKKKSTVAKILTYLLLLFTVLTALLAVMSPLFATFAVVFGILWYFLQFRFYREYEYSYFDGELRFARIKNKSRRKRLGIYSMDNVLQIAPAGDRSVHHYETDNGTKRVNYTSGQKDVPYYEVVIKDENGISLIAFEPDEKYLDAVCVKYSQKVIRK